MSIIVETEMQDQKKIVSKAKLQFKILPLFANHLLTHKIREFTKTQLDMMFEMNFPLLKYYDLSIYTEEQLIDLSIPIYVDFLKATSQNNLDDFINTSIEKWITNQLPNVSRDQLVVEDITLITHIRKKGFLAFISSYTQNIEEAIELVREIDDYALEASSRSFHAYVNIHNDNANKMNETLKKHEEDLLEAQEISSLGSFEWNLSGGKSVYTPQVFKIFEMEQAGNLEDFMQYVHPSDREKLKKAIEEALSGKKSYECEYRFRKHGHEKILWTKGIVTFKDNKPYVMKGTIMDITDRHYILKRLERNEELYKQAQKLTHIGNWTWELNTGEIKLSDELYRIYGLEHNPILTLDEFISFVHPDDKGIVHEKLKESVRTHQPHNLDFRIIRKDGEERIIRRNAEVYTDENNEPYKVAGTGQDITTEVLLIKGLKEREENFSQLIQNAPDSIVAINEKGNIILWNQKATKLFGWENKDVCGKKLEDAIIPEEYRELYTIKNLLTINKRQLLNKTIETTIINSQRKKIHISLTVSQTMQNGKPVYITFIRDVSDEKKNKLDLEIKTKQLAELNASLQHKNLALERSNKELTSFSYVASHDLQEPLRKIRTFINLILEKEHHISEEGKECFDRIITSAGRMQKLIEDLLSFSRIQLYESTVLKPVDLNIVVEELIALHNERIVEGNLFITASKLPTVNVIPFQMQQLLGNLISNSIKYSKPGNATEIKISSMIVHGNDLNLFNLEQDKDYFKITISDNGIGFEQQYSEKIFEIFQRLHTRNEYSGTGIGLSICKRIAENHHGTITANSTLNDGATFDIYLPC